MVLVLSLEHGSSMVSGRSMLGQFEGLTGGRRVGGGTTGPTRVSVSIVLST
jgi:hypothetical protein